jgi:hypothetical protein
MTLVSNTADFYFYLLQSSCALFRRMGKDKPSAKFHMHQYVSEFKDVFMSDGKGLFCQACGMLLHKSILKLHNI